MARYSEGGSGWGVSIWKCEGKVLNTLLLIETSLQRKFREKISDVLATEVFIDLLIVRID